MNRFPFLRVIAFFGIFVNFLAISSRAADPTAAPAPKPPIQVEDLLTAPSILTRDLGDSFHLAIPIKHPAHSRLLFVNFPSLKQKGVALPSSGMTPPYEARLNNTFLWVTDTTGNPDDYIPGSDSQGQADLYGGSGGVSGYGSGRAFEIGDFQVKFEKTGLSPNNGDFTHTYGHGALSRALSEVLWGEVNQDFPNGANRVLTVSDRGTYTNWPDGGREREGGLTRETPERPAHVIPIMGTPPEDGFPPEIKQKLDELNAKRIPEGMKNLLNVLPQPPNLPANRTPEEKFKTGTYEFLDRWADNKSYEVANRFLKGDTSPSNMEWSGKLIDYDAMTAQPSYMILKNESGDIFGSNHDIGTQVIDPLFYYIHEYAPKNFSAVTPSVNEALEYFRNSYKYHLARNFVELTGIPRPVLLKLEKEPNGKELITNLGNLLDKTAFHGSQQVQFVDTLPDITTTYDLPRILVDLASQDPTDAKKLNPAIEQALPDSKLRQQLVDSYSKLMSATTQLSARDGVSLQAFQTMIYDNSKMRNADIPDMGRPTLRWEDVKLVDEYVNQGQDRSKVWDSINSRVAKSRRNYRGDHPYQIVLAENEDALNRTVIRHVFDAKENRYETVVQMEAQDGKVSFFGKEVPLSEIAKKTLSSDTDHGVKGISPTVVGQKVEFKLPANADTTNVVLGLEPGGLRGNVTFIKKNSLPWHPGTPDQNLPKLELNTAGGAPAVHATSSDKISSANTASSDNAGAAASADAASSDPGTAQIEKVPTISELSQKAIKKSPAGCVRDRIISFIHSWIH